MLAVTMLLALGCASHGRWERAVADPAGANLTALVDSDPARALLQALLARGSTDPSLAARTAAVVSADLIPPASARHPGRLPDQAALREMALETSMDFAALTFAQTIRADGTSGAVQAAFDRFLREGPGRSEEILRRPGAFPYTVLLVPAWLYRSHPENGADFARQRRLLDRLGIANRLVPTAQSGSVEDNAASVAAAVREARREPGALILLSASKSGAEVALALSRLLAPDEAASIAGWLNVAGALRGSPLADAALRPPASWFFRVVFWITGWNWEGLASMATDRSRRRLEHAVMPDSIAVINLVAVPVSGSVGAKVVLGYQALRGHGPNDGVVLLADTVWPGGANIVALGADHLFVSLQEDAHGMALLRAMDFAVRLHGGRRALER